MRRNIADNMVSNEELKEMIGEMMKEMKMLKNFAEKI